MIDPNARGVDPAWDGIGAYELGKVGACSGAIINPILNRPCIKDWLDSWSRLLPHKVIRNILDRCCHRLGQTESFIRNEEKRALPAVVQSGEPNRSAKGSPKVILPKRRRRIAIVIVEPIVRIEEVISEIVEEAPMEIVCSRSG